jgi:glycine/D-amino acid oxidase-like deaminating enzyme
MSLGLVVGRILANTLLGRPADPRLSLFAPERFSGAPE